LLGTLIDPSLVPLRDAFVALFFVSLLWKSLPLLGVMLPLIVVGKFLVWSSVVWIFRNSIWTALAVAAGLTQIGELSFVVVQVARSSGMVSENVFSTVIAASLLSILVNVFFVRGMSRWLHHKFSGADPTQAGHATGGSGHAGRHGSARRSAMESPLVMGE